MVAHTITFRPSYFKVVKLVGWRKNVLWSCIHLIIKPITVSYNGTRWRSCSKKNGSTNSNVKASSVQKVTKNCKSIIIRLQKFIHFSSKTLLLNERNKIALNIKPMQVVIIKIQTIYSTKNVSGVLVTYIFLTFFT